MNAHRFSAALVLLVFLLSVGAALADRLPTHEFQFANESPMQDAAEHSVTTQAVGNAAEVSLVADLGADAISTMVQNIRVTNRHATQDLCVFFVDRTSDCAVECPAATKTCSGAATDGDHIGAGKSLDLPPIDGTVCACGIASALATTTTASRVARKVR